MQHKKNLGVGCVILSASLLASCGSIRLKNHEYCGDMGDAGATCANTFTDATREVSKAEWDKERVGWICSRSDAFAEMKTLLLSMCRRTRRCTYPQREALRRLGVNLEALEYGQSFNAGLTVEARSATLESKGK